MDIFTQKKSFTIIIAILVIMNLGTLTLLWIGRPSNMRTPVQTMGPHHEQVQIQQLLQEELGFDQYQVESYLQMRMDHQQKTMHFEHEIMELKRQMFEEVLNEGQPAVLSESLLAVIQDRNAQLDRLTFQHLVDLKKLCRSDQQDKLQMLIHELFMKSQPPGGPPPPDRRQ